MKHCKPILLASVLIALGGASLAFGQGTAFTYQGQLTDNGTAAQGSYDLRFRLYNDAAAGSQVGGEVTVLPVAVSNGLFTVALDFGAPPFNGAARWLDIGVRTNGSVAAYTTLTPRQALTAAPYALYALNASNASAADSLPWSGLTGLPAGFADGVDNDTLYGAGSGLTLAGTNFSLNPAFTDARYWKLTGNSGTTPGVNFLGTTDNQALELKVNNVRALRLEPNLSSPNVLGGHNANVADGGAYGATIGGGGSAGNINRISADFGTIGGGFGNSIQTNAISSTIGGGARNTIQTNATYATLGGGWLNRIQSDALYATVSGGHDNTIRTAAGVATIGGGANNTIHANAYNSTIGGGGPNTIQDDASAATIGGGNHNTIQTYAYDSTVGGGSSNTIQTNAYDSTIGGGTANTIQADANGSTISGGTTNNIEANSSSATIAGGYLNDIGTNSDRSAIGGGAHNHIEANSLSAAITGGSRNHISTNSEYSAIGGGTGNNIAAKYATVAGGYYSGMLKDSDYSAVGGGYYNVVQTNAPYATIPGGKQAKAAAYGQFAYASGQFAARGDAQASMFVLRRTATGATTNELFLDGSGEQITVPTNTTWAFDILIVGRSSDGGDFGAFSAAYQVRGLVVHDNLGTRVFALTPTVIHEDYGPWSVSVGTDGAGSHLTIKVVSTDFTVRWVANVRTAEVAFP